MRGKGKKLERVKGGNVKISAERPGKEGRSMRGFFIILSAVHERYDIFLIL